MDFKNYNIVDGFNVIAPAYDLANDAMTLGLHRLWRKKLCSMASLVTPKGGRLLDLATGTGDVIFGIEEKRPDIYFVGVDPSQGMLKVAEQKSNRKPERLVSLNSPSGSKSETPKKLEFSMGDARKLEFPRDSFDTVTISWGIRNVVPFSAAFSEVLRVLKPGGTFLILESGTPEIKIVNKFYQMYAKIIPYIGGKIAGYLPAYQYYTQSVDSFPKGKTFVAQLHENGFTSPKYQSLGGGIVYLYSAKKPLN
jgi:demethylmenaquinone methyltransferase / 2-methoxy-6-polyprenyl-1,4-benzoquinol methylase